MTAISFSPTTFSQVGQTKSNAVQLTKVVKNKSDPKPVELVIAPAPVAVAETPAPVPAPAPAPAVSSGGGCEQYRSLISQYSWNVETAIQVCNVESGGRADNANWGDVHPTCMGSFGLFQIGCDSTGGLSIDSLFDPATNIAHAAAMWASRGWQPWSFTTCAYKVVCI